MRILEMIGKLPGAKPETMQRIQSALDGTHERRMGFMKCLCRIHQGLLKAGDETAMFDQVCRELAGLPEVTAAWVAVPTVDGSALEVLPGAGLAPVDRAGVVIPLGPETGTPVAPQVHAFRTAQPLCLTQTDFSVGVDPIRHFLSFPKASGQRLLCLPVRQVNEAPLGVISLYLEPGDGLPAEAPELLEELADDVGRAMSALRRERRLSDNFQSLGRIFDETVTTLSGVLEFHDPRTARHQKNVTNLAGAMAKALGASDWVKTGISILARLHDVGKLLLPRELLGDDCVLGAREVEQVKSHAEAGFNILRGIQFPWPVAEAVRQHHERLNGNGYPRRLKGGEILWEARLLAVADATESMINLGGLTGSPRNVNFALRELARNRNTLYDPTMVDVCTNLLRSGQFSFAPALGRGLSVCRSCRAAG